MNKPYESESFKVKSLMIYILRHIPYVVLAMLLGMVLLSVWNLKLGRSISAQVKDKDTISLAELERSRSDLETTKNSYENSKSNLETQKLLAEEYTKNLEEYEEKYRQDIWISANPQRHAIKTVYFMNGNNDWIIDIVINGMRNALESLYDELAACMGDGWTAYNIQRLFGIDFNTGTNQLIISCHFDEPDQVEKAAEFYHNWINTKFTEYVGQYPDSELSLTVSDENQYEFYHNDMFNEQRNADNNRIGLQNAIINTNNTITSLENEVTSQAVRIMELEKTLKKNEALREGTYVISEEEDKMVSKSSLVIYAILGAFCGAVLGCMILCYQFMYGKKIRDGEDLESKTGAPLLAVVGTRSYKGIWKSVNQTIDRILRLADVRTIEEKEKAAAVEMELAAARHGSKNLAIVGTCDYQDDDTKKFLNYCTEQLEQVGIKLIIVGNPQKDPEAAKRMAAAEEVLLMEKAGVSETKDVRVLREYLENRDMAPVGVIII